MDASSTFDELLGLKATAAAKKGAMKAPSGKAAQFGHAAARSMHRMGVVKQVTAQHLVDGRPLLLEMQVSNWVSYQTQLVVTWPASSCAMLCQQPDPLSLVNYQLAKCVCAGRLCVLACCLADNAEPILQHCVTRVPSLVKLVLCLQFAAVCTGYVVRAGRQAASSRQAAAAAA